ncbi:MAG: selenium metabolism-associated LysR family transcriptional regulator [Bacillota bacterium]|nr:selenium metabolism-associated LysR family transcriptional regulator [Bacillota bacterium]
MVNLRQLEAFVAVVEQRNFTRAAKTLAISQPAVSFLIHSLEEHLGVQLLERLGRQVRLTPAGEVVYAEAKNILAAQERMHEALASLNSLQAGRVVVGASTIPGEYVLPRLAGEFKALYPRVKIALRIGESTKVAEWLLDRTVDLGVVGVTVDNPQLRFTRIFSDELVVVMPAGHPLAAQPEIALEELVKEPFVLRGAGSGTRQIFEHALLEAGLSPDRLNAVMELDTTRAVLSAVEAGVGVSVVSRWAVAELERSLVARPVAGGHLVRELFLAENTVRYMAPAARRFAEYLVEHGPREGALT